MSSEWEEKLRDRLDFSKIKRSVSRSDNYEIIGIAIAHAEFGEGCFIKNPDINESSAMFDIDVWSDIQHDVNENYDRALFAYQDAFGE